MLGRWRSARRRRRLDVDAVLRCFQRTASASGSPRGLLWRRVAAAGDPVWIRDGTAEAALLPVEVDFAADDSGEMDDAPGLDLTRGATLILRWHDGWRADEKALFNLGPDDVVARSGGRFIPASRER